MAAQTELTLLKREEHLLRSTSRKIREQLSRLKVEELALISQIRQTQRPPITLPSSSHNGTDCVVSFQNSCDVNKKAICLDVKMVSNNEFEIANNEEEEEEEDDDDEVGSTGNSDQLSAFLKGMERKTWN